MLKNILILFFYLFVLLAIGIFLMFFFTSGEPLAQKITQTVVSIFSTPLTQNVFKGFTYLFVLLIMVMVCLFLFKQFWYIPMQLKSFAKQNGFEYKNILNIIGYEIRGNHNIREIFVGYPEPKKGEDKEVDFMFWVEVPGMPKDLEMNGFSESERALPNSEIEINSLSEFIKKMFIPWVATSLKQNIGVPGRYGAEQHDSPHTDQQESSGDWLNSRRQEIIRDMLSDHKYALRNGGVVFRYPDYLKTVKDLNSMLWHLEAISDQLR